MAATKAVYSAGYLAAHSAARKEKMKDDCWAARSVAPMVATKAANWADSKVAKRAAKKVVCSAIHWAESLDETTAELTAVN